MRLRDRIYDYILAHNGIDAKGIIKGFPSLRSNSVHAALTILAKEDRVSRVKGPSGHFIYYANSTTVSDPPAQIDILDLTPSVSVMSVQEATRALWAAMRQADYTSVTIKDDGTVTFARRVIETGTLLLSD